MWWIVFLITEGCLTGKPHSSVKSCKHLQPNTDAIGNTCWLLKSIEGPDLWPPARIDQLKHSFKTCLNYLTTHILTTQNKCSGYSRK